MKDIKYFLFILFLTLSSCTNSAKHTVNCKDVKKYKINYLSRNRDVSLIVFDNNDTLYINSRDMKFNEYVKVKSNEKTVSEIKKTINNHINRNSLLLDRPRGLHQGVLTLSVTGENKKIQLNLSGVSDDYLVTKEFNNLMNDLIKKHNEVDLAF